MALSPEQMAARDGKITASFLPYLMAGDSDKIMREWMRLVEHPDYAPEDLSGAWPVQFGSYIETFALDWHERHTGCALTRRGEVVTHPRLPHVACTLDAWRADDNTVIDCKALSAYRKLDEACAFYLPQMVVQRGCVSADAASLLVVHGGAEPKEFPLTIPADYAATVWARIDEFWQCVLDLTPPVVMAPIAAPVPAVVEYDMSYSNAWAMEAAAWLEHRGAAKRFAAAEKELKSLIPQDGKRAFGFGVEATRDKAGRLSLKEARA